jgi:hypothetical protein
MLLTIIALKKAKNSKIQETDIWIQYKILITILYHAS